MNISLLGLFVNERKVIKQYFEKYLPNQEIQWVSANEETIDILVTRAAFLETNTLASFLHKLKKQQTSSILCIAKNADEKCKSDQRNIPCIVLPVTQESEISHWLLSVLSKFGLVESMVSLGTQKQSLSNIVSLKQFLKILLLFSDHPKKIQIDEEIYWFDRQTQFVYTRGKFMIDLRQSSWIDHGTYSFDDIPSNVVSMPISEWIWTTIWYSSYSFEQQINHDVAYALTHWPRFCRTIKIGRMETIKLTAILQQRSLTYDQIVRQSLIEPPSITKYLFLADLFGCIQKVAKPLEQEQYIRIEHTTKKKRKGFLAQLKKFIGI